MRMDPMSENVPSAMETTESATRAKRGSPKAADGSRCAECGRKMAREEMLWDYPRKPGEYVTVCEACYIKLCWTPRRAPKE